MLAGADDAEAIEDFGDAHHECLRQFQELPNGIPSQDTWLRVFAAIGPAAFQAMLRAGGQAIHRVSAWLADDGLVLRQIKTAEKSNEITAIPDLLRLIDIRGATVTMDATGCRRTIAEQLIDSGAHHALAVKDNQPTLSGNIRGWFRDAARQKRPLNDPPPMLEKAREADAGRGRVQERTCGLSHDLSWIEKRDE